MASVLASLGAFLFLFCSNFLYFGGVFNKTVTPFVLVGYEMDIASSYPTRVREVIVKAGVKFE